jgi:hypothetical protein
VAAGRKLLILVACLSQKFGDEFLGQDTRGVCGGGMGVALITGAAALIGFEAVRLFASRGLRVVGIDNEMRAYFFGPGASTAGNRQHLERA